MKLSDHLNYLARLIKGYKKREICLAKALKCKSEIEKINFSAFGKSKKYNLVL